MRGLQISNAYAVACQQGIALIDSGSPGDVDRILAQLQHAEFGVDEAAYIVVDILLIDGVLKILNDLFRTDRRFPSGLRINRGFRFPC